MNKAINLQYTTFTTPLPDFIYDGIKEYVKHANSYLSQPANLIEKIAKKHNLQTDMIFLTAGADEAIRMFTMVFGKKTYIFTPTYVVYDDMRYYNADITHVNALNGIDYQIDTKNIPNATLIFIANPNSPCGFTSKEKVIELIKNNPQAIIVVDEVYAEFADLSVADEIKNYSNLAVLRSFSKSYGMAGNRIGYILANQEMINKLRPMTQWANVSCLSIGSAIIALDHNDYFAQLIKEIKDNKDQFYQFLVKKGFHVFPSLINAILIKFPDEEKGSAFYNYLKQNDFITSHGNGNSNVGLDKSFVRISIGNKSEMEKIQKVIDRYGK